MKQQFTFYIKSLLLIMILSSYQTAFAQAPQKFNYQGIARDSKGNPMSNHTLALKLSILPTADARESEYEETQQVTTNEFGLYTLQIGNGVPLVGEMKSVSWETGNKYIQVAIDPQGGNNYVVAGTNQLLSVPYAIYADKAGIAKETIHTASNNGTRAGTLNYISKFDATGSSSNEINSQIFDNGTNIGIGTTTPGGKIHSRVTTGNNLTIFENTNAAGTTRQNFQADGSTNYCTVQKRGSNFTGNASVATMPLANLFSFGNNVGAMLLNSQGNMGIAPTISGALQYKFLTDTLSGNVGLAGNSIPTARVHINNTQATTANLRITNNTSGHTANDGLELLLNGNAASILNKENSTLQLGVNSLPSLSLLASGNTEILGQIKINGGTPGLGKVLTSDATGLASWQTPSGGGGGSQWTSSGNNIYNSNSGNVGIGNIAPTSRLQVTDAITTLTDGVIRGEYTGALLSDIVGIYGKSTPSVGYGIGVLGEGGAAGLKGNSAEIGVEGNVLASGLGRAIYGNGSANGIGVEGFSSNSIAVNAISNAGNAVEATSQLGTGVYALSFNGNAIEATSLSARAIYAYTDTTNCAYFKAGTTAPSAALQNQGVVFGEYTGTNAQNAIGVFGKSTPPSVAHGIGVKGEANWIGVLGSATGSNFAGYFFGKTHTTGVASAGTKAFKIDHPLDPANKYLFHSSVESNDMMNMYSDNVVTDANGKAVVQLPTYFQALNKDYKYQLTVIGSFAQAMIAEEIANNQFIINTNQPNVKVSWLVMGVRKDPVANAHRIVAEVEKTALEKGKYLNPIEYGQGIEKSLVSPTENEH